MTNRIRAALLTAILAVAAVLSTLGIAAPDVLTDLWSDNGPEVTVEPVPEGSSPEADPTLKAYTFSGEGHTGLRFEDRDVKGEVKSGLPRRSPLATPSQRGCITNLVQNFSSRGGVAPRMFVLHYTVSANRAGTSDVNAIRSFFDNPASQASSNYIIDFEGNCILAVGETNKAWTQGAFNPSSISIEFIATGSESTEAWKTTGLPGLKKGALVVADAIKRWNIPLRFVDPVNCTVTAGITDHNNLECGNNHHDVTPNFPYHKFMTLVTAAADIEPKFRYQLRDDGEIKAQSRTFQASNADARLTEFLTQTRALMLRRFGRNDGDFNLKRVKVSG